jgi:ABC-type uncharacterized transport system substrate-binding protein
MSLRRGADVISRRAVVLGAALAAAAARARWPRRRGGFTGWDLSFSRQDAITPRCSMSLKNTGSSRGKILPSITIDARPVLNLTRSTPIVVVTAADPVSQRIAASLARPGANVTGTALGNTELVPKLLELVHELVPAAGRVSVLGDPRSPGNIEVPVSVGEALGELIVSRHASQPDELDTTFAAAARDGDRAIVVQMSPLTFEERWRVIALASRFRLPAVYPLRDYVEAGGLLSYGPVIKDNFERAAVLVDKILRGANPTICRSSSRPISNWSST